MKNGIYHVRFSSSSGSGEGLAVVKDGTVNGGDPGYLYLGQLTVVGQTLHGRLQIQRWNPGTVSVFGPLDNFALDLAGLSGAANDEFTVSGGIAGQPNLKITITGRRLAAAA